MLVTTNTNTAITNAIYAGSEAKAYRFLNCGPDPIVIEGMIEPTGDWANLAADGFGQQIAQWETLDVTFCKIRVRSDNPGHSSRVWVETI
jgi:hypothetical protein